MMRRSTARTCPVLAAVLLGVLLVLPGGARAAPQPGSVYTVQTIDLGTGTPGAEVLVFAEGGAFATSAGTGFWLGLGPTLWVALVPSAQAGEEGTFYWGVINEDNGSLLGFESRPGVSRLLFGVPDDPSCDVDTDGDRLPDCVETGTGVFVDEDDTGTDRTKADTDGDSINDGDEVLGTVDGLDLPAMGVSPLRKNILLEYDWFDDAVGCAAHSHRPTLGMLTRVAVAFESAPVPNPDGSTGITLIQDIGQGGALSGGNLIDDPDGVIVGGVSGAEYKGYKAEHFAANRNGYFHYVLLPHRYNTSSGSSGQAEIRGDDMIVSLACSGSERNVANTIMHELGHNLGLRHGGFENCNYKPNYNSVMNYRYQFPGVDTNCTPPGNGLLDFSVGDRVTLDEAALDESVGVCGPGKPYDWNGNSLIEALVEFDTNTSGNSTCGGTFTVLSDHDDWGAIFFGGIGDFDGAPFSSISEVEIASCMAVPPMQ